MVRSKDLNPFSVLNALFGWHKHPRNGKIARLPAPTREAINRMLDDGLPYKTILANVVQLDPQLSALNLSEMNLSNWVHGGYQDWLQQQREAEFLRRLPEAQRQQARQILPDLRHPRFYRLSEQEHAAARNTPVAHPPNKPDPQTYLKLPAAICTY